MRILGPNLLSSTETLRGNWFRDGVEIPRFEVKCYIGCGQNVFHEKENENEEVKNK